MRPILSFLATANHRALKNSRCSAFSTLTHHTCTLNYPNYQNRSLDWRSVRVSAWLDLETCNFPLIDDPFQAAEDFCEFVKGFGRPTNIRAFGDVMQISETNQDALYEAVIDHCHVPLENCRGAKHRVYESLRHDLMGWVSQNPPPAHIFLCSGDEGFVDTLHKLRIVATPDGASNALCSAASIMWQWNSLLKGEGEDHTSGSLLTISKTRTSLGITITKLGKPHGVAENGSGSQEERAN